jgi:hypothetical protein
MALLEKPFEKVRPKMVTARLELMSQLAKFSPGELRCLPQPGEWSALEIAHHVYITDGLSLELMCRVQDEENPLIHALEDEAPHRTYSSEPPVSLDAVLGGMAARREEIFEYLNALPPTAWERPFRHPHWGQLKFYQLVNILPQHDRLHAQQLADLKGAIPPAQP